MNKKALTLLFLLLLPVMLFACRRSQPDATLAPDAGPATVVAEETVVPTPPVATPTIPIPVATATSPPPAVTAGPQSATTRPTPADVPEVEPQTRPRFAAFRPSPVEVVPVIYHDPIAPDLGNVVVPFVLSEAQRARLAGAGFVVSPGTEKEFFTVYEQARYANVPIFVTSDSLLHVYHLLFDKILRTAEQQYFIPLLADLNAALLAQADGQYQALQGTGWEDAARRTVAFAGVGSKLLEPDLQVPAYARDLVDGELDLIEAAAGIQPSPLFPGLDYGEDYTQYIPRGHYTRSDDLRAYFKSMMWYGRMTFRLKTRNPEVGRAETRSALLLVNALQDSQVRGRPALDAWLDLYNPTVFFVGRSDDLTAFQYLDVIEAVYGPEPGLERLTDEALLDVFIEAADLLPPPEILGIVIADTDDVEEQTKGLRFMGQRFVPDAYIFRQLIYRNVGTRADPRLLPKGLDVMAALGSERAYTILDELGETSYENYPSQMEKMQAWTAGLTEEEWTETLYNGWLYTFQPLLEAPGEGYPAFMQSPAWLDKQLNSTLGSWAELKHDTILYAKQVYAEMGGGAGNAPQPELARGYVEPVPHFYARLSALSQMTLDGLDQRGLLADQDRDSLQRLIRLADAFRLMAEKQLRGEPLTEEEHHLVRFYGGELEHLVMASADREEADAMGQPFMEEEPQAAVIADVATAPDYVFDGVPDPAVLEEGVGRIDEIYVVVPLVLEDGSLRLQVAKGGVFSYYEFPWPAEDRLTDEAWREMLDAGEAPDRPLWIDSFFVPETEYAAFQEAIYAFQRSLAAAYWELDPEWVSAADPVRDQMETQFERWQEEGHYAGHQWLNASYRSFDIQSEERAVVTVRETWQDWLYAFDEAPGDANSTHEPVAARGPYTLDVTYTLEPGEFERWQVTNVVFNTEPPAWEELAD